MNANLGRKIAGEFLSESSQQNFPANFRPCFSRVSGPPPPKKYTPKIHAKIVVISFQIHIFEPNIFHANFLLTLETNTECKNRVLTGHDLLEGHAFGDAAPVLIEHLQEFCCQVLGANATLSALVYGAISETTVVLPQAAQCPSHGRFSCDTIPLRPPCSTIGRFGRGIRYITTGCDI